MSNTFNQQQQDMDNVPPLGYPTLDSPEMKIKNKKKRFHRIKKRGDGFLKGCLAGLCCCWVCETCCF